MILPHLANQFAAIPNASGNISRIHIPQLKAGMYSTTRLNYQIFVLQLPYSNSLCKNAPPALPSLTGKSQFWKFAIVVPECITFWTKTVKFF